MRKVSEKTYQEKFDKRRQEREENKQFIMDNALSYLLFEDVASLVVGKLSVYDRLVSEAFVNESRKDYTNNHPKGRLESDCLKDDVERYVSNLSQILSEVKQNIANKKPLHHTKLLS